MRWVITTPIIVIYSLVFCHIYLYIETLVIGKAHYVWKPYTISLLEPDPKLVPGVSGRKTFSANRYGLRGPDISRGSLRILVFGGSTTEQYYVGDSDNWAQHIAQFLNEDLRACDVVVNNAAKGGLELRHYYLQAKYLLPELESIDMAVIFPGPNDLIRFIGMPKGEDVKYSRKIDRAAFDRIVSAYPPWAAEIRTKTYDRLRGLVKTQTQRLLMKMRLWKPKEQGLVRDPVGKFYETVRSRRKEARKVELPKDKRDRLDYELKRYRRLLEQTVDIIKENDVEPILLTHPINYSPDMRDEQKELWWAGALYGNPQITGGLKYLTEAAMADLLEKYNQQVREVAEEKGVALVDLAEEFRFRTDLFYDQWHLNEYGSKEIGKAVAGVLTKRLSPEE